MHITVTLCRVQRKLSKTALNCIRFLQKRNKDTERAKEGPIKKKERRGIRHSILNLRELLPK